MSNVSVRDTLLIFPTHLSTARVFLDERATNLVANIYTRCWWWFKWRERHFFVFDLKFCSIWNVHGSNDNDMIKCQMYSDGKLPIFVHFISIEVNYDILLIDWLFDENRTWRHYLIHNNNNNNENCLHAIILVVWNCNLNH